MIKQIKFNKEARVPLQKGVNIVANAVKVTMGAKGRNVTIKERGGTPKVTKDGVTVAKSIFLKDEHMDTGAQMLKQAALKSNDLAGDGTTTATVLAQSMVNSAFKEMEEEGYNPMEMKSGMDMAVEAVVKELEKLSIKIDTNSKSLRDIANISANNDKTIGKFIADAFKKVGDKGVVTVEQSPSMNTYTDVVKGMKLETGFSSPLFITDGAKKEAVLHNPYVLIYDGAINNVGEIVNIMNIVSATKESVLIIADEFQTDSLPTLVTNKTRGLLKICTVKSPDFGMNKKYILQDIAIATGGVVLGKESGFDMDSITLDHLGRADKAIIDKSSTIIIGGKGNKETISTRIEELNSQIKAETMPLGVEKLTDRLGSLVGGVGVIYVGGYTEMEMKERKDRFDDALGATRASLEEGVVTGGGLTLLKCIPLLEELKSRCTNKAMGSGIGVIISAMKSPINTIIENCGVKGQVSLDYNQKDDMGYNAKTDQFEDLFKAGVIDPKKVTRVALESANSVAGMIITTEAAIFSDE